MKCEYCENELPGGVTSCPFCGAAIAAAASENDSATGMNSFQDSGQPQVQTEEEFRNDREILQLKSELEQEKRKLAQLQQNSISETEISPCKRIVFVLLGIAFGILGVQFLYARRFISFGVFLSCFVLFMIIFHDLAAIEVFVALASFLASFIVSTDGHHRKMRWF